MSILIKGLSLPTDGSIEIQVFSEGKAIKSGYTVRVNGMDYYQPTIGETTAVDAIELPPHGRLIDADALDTSVLQAGFSYAITRRKLRYTAGEVREKIANAPTVIEAEGE